MKTLVIYDSKYGNTAKVAERVVETATAYGSAHRKLADEVESGDFDGIDVLFIGTPTQGGRPTERLQEVIDTYAPTLPSTVHVAAFDTRLNPRTVGRWLKLLMRMIGFAAPKIAHSFQHGSTCIVERPEGFIVTGNEGPLAKGELDRVTLWVKRVMGRSKKS